MGRMDPYQYFLVLRPSGDLYHEAKKRQRSLAEEYELYQIMPMLHVTLLQLELKGREVWPRVRKRVESFAEGSGPIALSSRGYRCYRAYNRSLTLLLHKGPALRRISQDLIDSLKDIEEIRFLGPSLEEREYHITLASTLFSDNPWSEEEFIDICHHIDREGALLSGYASSLEIWRPRLLPEEAILASFPLSSQGRR